MVLTGKIHSITGLSQKQEEYQTHNLTLHWNELEKEQQSLKWIEINKTESQKNTED